jgi:hypothetical protein
MATATNVAIVARVTTTRVNHLPQKSLRKGWDGLGASPGSDLLAMSLSLHPATCARAENRWLSPQRSVLTLIDGSPRHMPRDSGIHGFAQCRYLGE